MDQAEEVTLLSGDGTSSYIGQVNGIPNLCIKSLNMEDGPSGVGDGNGGVTAFPDGENAAATWDPTLIQQEGAAKGAEFAGKGVEHLARPDNQPGARPALGPDLRDLRRGPVPGRPDHLGRGRGPAEPGRDGRRQARRRLRPGAVPQRQQQRDGQPAGAGGALPGAVPDRDRAVRPGRRSCAPTPWSTTPPPARTPTCCRTDSYEQANSGGFVISDWGAAGNAVADARGRHGHRDAVLRREPRAAPPSRRAR